MFPDPRPSGSWLKPLFPPRAPPLYPPPPTLPPVAPGGVRVFIVSIEFTIAGSVDAFDADGFHSALALFLRLPRETLEVRVISGSIVVRCAIRLKTHSAALRIAALMTDSFAAAISQAAGVIIEAVGKTVITWRILAAPSPLPAPSPWQPPPAAPLVAPAQVMPLTPSSPTRPAPTPPMLRMPHPLPLPPSTHTPLTRHDSTEVAPPESVDAESQPGVNVSTAYLADSKTSNSDLTVLIILGVCLPTLAITAAFAFIWRRRRMRKTPHEAYVVATVAHHSTDKNLGSTCVASTVYREPEVIEDDKSESTITPQSSSPSQHEQRPSPDGTGTDVSVQRSVPPVTRPNKALLALSAEDWLVQVMACWDDSDDEADVGTEAKGSSEEAPTVHVVNGIYQSLLNDGNLDVDSHEGTSSNENDDQVGADSHDDGGAPSISSAGDAAATAVLTPAKLCVALPRAAPSLHYSPRGTPILDGSRRGLLPQSNVSDRRRVKRHDAVKVDDGDGRGGVIAAQQAWVSHAAVYGLSMPLAHVSAQSRDREPPSTPKAEQARWLSRALRGDAALDPLTHALHSSAVVGLPPRILDIASPRKPTSPIEDNTAAHTAAVSARLTRIRQEREARQAAGQTHAERQAVLQEQLAWVRRAQSYGVEHQRSKRIDDPSSTTGERSWLERELKLDLANSPSFGQLAPDFSPSIVKTGAKANSGS